MQSWPQSPALVQLAQRRPNQQLKIGLLEWSDRVGGRIDSYILSDM
jgi:hypothetical protein